MRRSVLGSDLPDQLKLAFGGQFVGDRGPPSGGDAAPTRSGSRDAVLLAHRPRGEAEPAPRRGDRRRGVSKDPAAEQSLASLQDEPQRVAAPDARETLLERNRVELVEQSKIRLLAAVQRQTVG